MPESSSPQASDTLLPPSCRRLQCDPHLPSISAGVWSGQSQPQEEAACIHRSCSQSAPGPAASPCPAHPKRAAGCLAAHTRGPTWLLLVWAVRRQTGLTRPHLASPCLSLPGVSGFLSQFLHCLQAGLAPPPRSTCRSRNARMLFPVAAQTHRGRRRRPPHSTQSPGGTFGDSRAQPMCPQR